jgi:hypothetical protein
LRLSAGESPATFSDSSSFKYLPTILVLNSQYSDPTLVWIYNHRLNWGKFPSNIEQQSIST